MLLIRLCDADFRPGCSDDVKLTHGSPLSPAAFIKPLPVGRGGDDRAVLAAASVWLQGDVCLPVLEAHTGARMIQPLTVGHRVIDAQPDVLPWTDALADVVVELVILIPWARGAEDTSLGNAVFTGSIKGLLHGFGQETLANDLGASQTNWERNGGRLTKQKFQINVQRPCIYIHIPVCKACCSFSKFSSWARSLTCLLSSSIAELFAESVKMCKNIRKQTLEDNWQIKCWVRAGDVRAVLPWLRSPGCSVLTLPPTGLFVSLHKSVL